MLQQLFSRPASSAAGTVDHDSMVEAVRSGSHTLVDVRERNEFAAGTIAGAINVPLSAFDASSIPAGKSVIVFCATGGRSGIAQGMLAAAGRSAANYRPGVGGWRMQGMPLVHGR
jgi:rhodanese-related sulfurtransferase